MRQGAPGAPERRPATADLTSNPRQSSRKKLLKLNTSFFELRLAIFVRCYSVVSRWRIQVTCFFLSWTLLVLILPPQADPSTLKNLDFAFGFSYFLINRRFLHKDALQRRSGLSWAHMLPSWGGTWGHFWRPWGV